MSWTLALNPATGTLELVNFGSGGGGGTPGGDLNSIQFNDAGSFGGFGSWDGTQVALTGGVTASVTIDSGANTGLTWTSVFPGVRGNGLSVAYNDPGVPSSPLSYTSTSFSVSISLATDGGGVITTTANDIIAIVEANITVALADGSDGSGVVSATDGLIPLVGGISTLDVQSDISGAQSVITNSEELYLSTTGAGYGPVSLSLVNRNGSAGALFQNYGLDLCDFGFVGVGDGVESQNNLRYEHRGSQLQDANVTDGEFQFLSLVVNPSGLQYAAFGSGIGALATPLGFGESGAFVGAAKIQNVDAVIFRPTAETLSVGDIALNPWATFTVAGIDTVAYSVNGNAGASGTGTVISAITVENGIITAITVV